MSEFTHDGAGWDDQHLEQEGTGFGWPEHGLGSGLDAGNAGYESAGYGNAGEDGASYGAQAEIGNPSEYAHDWFFQQSNGYCAPSSLTQVIEAQAGTHLDGYGLVEQELAKLGLPSTDLTMPQAQEVLTGFGIPSHIVQGDDPQTAVTELTGYLEQGRNVVLAVNASPIWYGQADTSDNPDGQADHALVVSAIDPQTGVVTLSDPGTPSGNEEHVSMSTFLQAWSASDYQMLVTDNADPGASTDTGAPGALPGTAADPSAPDGPATPGGDGGGIGGVMHDVEHALTYGWVLLPIALGAEWVRTEFGSLRSAEADLAPDRLGMLPGPGSVAWLAGGQARHF
jgi:hypothetical protein